MIEDVERFVVALPAIVFMWQAVGAARTFSPVSRGPGASFTSGFISFAFIALVALDKPAPLDVRLVIAGCVGLLVSLALFEWARYSIRGRFFSYIFSSDTPAFLHTEGPYTFIRNPFYTSYLISMSSTAIMFQGLYRWLIVIAGYLYFWMAATFEERKFAKSSVAAEYELYKQRTGRFIPRLLLTGQRP